MPGILNWSLAGLKALRDNKDFSSTSDQEHLLQELELINDPIAAFVDDVIVPRIDQFRAMQNRDKVYNEYKAWCHKSNSVPMSSRWFWPRLRQKVTVTENRTPYIRQVAITLKN